MIDFDPVTHTYSRNGLVVPGVTSVIESVLDQFAGVPQEVLEQARIRGQHVHKATALYDLDDLDIATLDVALLPFLEAWIKFRKETGFHPLAVEEQIYHPRYHYAGTFDRVGALFGELALIDIKSGAVFPSVGPQSVAYAAAYNHRRADKIRTRWAVQLSADGNYKLHQLKDWNGDFSVFLSALNLRMWRIKNGC